MKAATFIFELLLTIILSPVLILWLIYAGIKYVCEAVLVLFFAFIEGFKELWEARE
jgi:hypothetical protein